MALRPSAAERTLDALKRHVIGLLGPTGPRPWLLMVGDAAGVELEGGPDGWNGEGVVDGWTVRVEHATGSPELRLVCATGGAIPRLFELKTEGLLQSDDLRTGDSGFDRRFRLRGPDRVVAAVVGREARELLLRLDAQARVTVKDGAVTAIVPKPWGGPDRTGRQLRDVVALARALSLRPDENADRLAARIVDPAESPALAGSALAELVLRWPGRVDAVAEQLRAQGSAELLAQLEEAKEALRRRQAQAAGAGGELAVVDEGPAGALSEVRSTGLALED